MPSDKQIQASRTNGARSKGPVTPQGKSNSARNSFRHGLLARTVVLEEESTGRFIELLAGYMDEFQPTAASQISLVETMAVARWRLLRIWGAQKTALDRDMALQDPAFGPAPVRVLAALSGSAGNSCSPELLLRYEIAYDRQFSRALVRLLDLQSRYVVPPGHTWKETEIQELPPPNEPGISLVTHQSEPPTPPIPEPENQPEPEGQPEPVNQDDPAAGFTCQHARTESRSPGGNPPAGQEADDEGRGHRLPQPRSRLSDEPQSSRQFGAPELESPVGSRSVR